MSDDIRPSIPTIYEVAARAGVSVTTISHALNRPERVAAATRERVLRVVDELGFVPRTQAVAAARTSRPLVAVVAPFVQHPSYLQRLAGVLRAAQDAPLEIVTLDVASLEHAATVLEVIATSGRYDAAILMGIDADAAFHERASRRGMPVVLVDRASTTRTSVGVDDRRSGRIVAEHLIAQGARSFGFVSHAPQEAAITAGELRVRGFGDAMRDAGLGDDMRWFVTDDSFDGGLSTAGQIVASRERGERTPDAFYVHHDELAAGLVVGLERAGCAVPDDVLVVGNDDAPIARSHGITTVRQPFAATGRVAVDALLAALADPAAPVRRIELGTDLVVRGSTVPGAAASFEVVLDPDGAGAVRVDGSEQAAAAAAAPAAPSAPSPSTTPTTGVDRGTAP